MTMPIGSSLILRTFSAIDVPLAQWDQLGEPGRIGWIAAIALAISIIGALLMAVDRFLRMQPELRKVRQETMAKAGQTLTLLQEKRGSYNRAVDDFAQQATALRTALESGAWHKIDEIREGCCRSLSRDVLETHINFVEFERLYYEGSPDDLREFIIDDLIGDIQRFTRWLRLLNHPKLLQQIPDGNRSPLIITSQSVKPWKKLPLALPPDYRQFAMDKLEPIIKEFLSTGLGKSSSGESSSHP